MHGLALFVCLLLMIAIRGLGDWAGVGEKQPTLALATGFVLLTAYVAGRASSRFNLPRLTGYLLLGILIGPRALNLITYEMSEGLLFINGLTISLIALSAGGELKMEWLRGRFKEIATVSVVGAAVVFLSLFLTVFLAMNWLPFETRNSLAIRLLISTIFGIFAMANSPMVVIALINETENRGPMAQTVLGVTIVRDVMVIVLFSLVLTLAEALGGAETVTMGEFLLMIGREIGGAIAIGLVLGGGLVLCTRYFWREMSLVVVVFCFFMAHLGTSLHVDPLLMGLTAGFFVENIARQRGPELIEGIERCSLPLYCLFFALAGVSLDIYALAELWPVALLLAAVRCFGLWVGTSLGGRIAGVDPKVNRYGWLGFIANAGVLLAMGSIVARTFPEWGDVTQTLVIALIGINLLVGPIAFRYALATAQEEQPGPR